jgi:aminoglycoside phosphotransferase (APT) family kinase protein
VTIFSGFVERGDVPALFAARALGRFAGTGLADVPWLCRDQLADRIARVDERGGWRTLARTTVADLADALWTRRTRLLAELRSLPQGAVHGDPTPQNLLARHEDDVVAIDWATLGTGALGGDLGYFSLSCREDADVLMDAYLAGVRDVGLVVDRADAVRASQIVSVYTAMSRADWALARVAGGEGALAAKYRHPSVSPYLRGLQRQFPQIEALLG